MDGRREPSRIARVRRRSGRLTARGRRRLEIGALSNRGAGKLAGRAAGQAPAPALLGPSWARRSRAAVAALRWRWLQRRETGSCPIAAPPAAAGAGGRPTTACSSGGGGGVGRRRRDGLVARSQEARCPARCPARYLCSADWQEPQRTWRPGRQPATPAASRLLRPAQPAQAQRHAPRRLQAQPRRRAPPASTWRPGLPRAADGRRTAACGAG